MPTFVVTDPQGKEFEVDAPEGATQEDALAYAQQQFSQMPEQPTTQEAMPTGQEAPLMAQVGRGMMDVYQGAKQFGINWADKMHDYENTVDSVFSPGSMMNKAAKSIMGATASLVPEVDAKTYNQQVSQELSLYNRNNPDFQMGRVMGSIATPLTLVPGGSATSLGGKILTGMGSGTLFSIFQPVEDKEGNPDEYWAQKGEQALWGAGLGGGIPVAGKIVGTLGGWLDELTKPLYRSGVYRDTAKFLKEHITENRDKITRAIQRAIDEGDDRTVGQIIADSTRGTGDDFGGMLVRLEKDMARESDALKSIYARQSADKRAFLDTLSGTKDDLQNAIARRAENGTRNYEAAFKTQVNADKELKGILNNKFAEKAMKEANDIVQAESSQPSLSRLLHYTKLGLDKQLASRDTNALGAAEKKAVGELKEKLVNWLENRNDAYRQARLQYQADSLPINRMRIGGELKDAFVGALDENKPSTFANALRNSDKVVKKVTGDPRYGSISEILDPGEISKLKSIADDLAVNKRAAEMAAKSKPILGEITGEVRVDLPAILSRPIVITNHLLKRLSIDKSKEYKKLVSDLVQNPDEFIRAYGGNGMNEKTKMAMDIARRLNIMIASQQASREAGAQ